MEQLSKEAVNKKGREALVDNLNGILASKKSTIVYLPEGAVRRIACHPSRPSGTMLQALGEICDDARTAFQARLRFCRAPSKLKIRESVVIVLDFVMRRTFSSTTWIEKVHATTRWKQMASMFRIASYRRRRCLRRRSRGGMKCHR